MKSNSESPESQKSSAVLLVSTLIGALSIVLLAALYYFSTNTHIAQ